MILMRYGGGKLNKAIAMPQQFLKFNGRTHPDD
jgi:hypothetical protein